MRNWLLIAASAIVVGCAGSPAALPVAKNAPDIPTASTSAYSVIYTFQTGTHGFNNPRGDFPSTPPAVLDGRLYGATIDGGTACSAIGCGGVVFSVTLDGHEKPTFELDSKPTLGWGAIDLIAMNGKLYGVVGGGPGTDDGQVFELSPSGNYRVLHNFTGSDGDRPSGLVAVNGTLYGTTEIGGDPTCSCGTIFSVTTSGKFSVLHTFRGKDGAVPMSPPIDVNGVLYGTTMQGGNVGCPFDVYSKIRENCGTIYSITLSGTERVLYAFSNKDQGGYDPWDALTFESGALYGTTFWGGVQGSKCWDGSCGSVFATDINTGSTRFIYQFKGGTDGANPRSKVTFANNTLYGTTGYGGTPCETKVGCGTVYSVSTAGTERVLHAFTQSESDGSIRMGPIVYKNALYGAAPGDASDFTGFGVIYKIGL